MVLLFFTMFSRKHLLILALHVSFVVGISQPCNPGWFRRSKKANCTDIDECTSDLNEPICGENTKCLNTIGSFYCQCLPGFAPQNSNFTASSTVKCKDIQECTENKDVCGPNSRCENEIGSYCCFCSDGYYPSNGKEIFQGGEGITCKDRDECETYETICGQKATCHNLPGSYCCVCSPGFRLENGKVNFTEGEQGSCKEICEIDQSFCGNGTCRTAADGPHCDCHAGFTNYGNAQSRCKELSCDMFTSDNHETLPGLEVVMTQLRTSCLKLSRREGLVEDGVDGEVLLKAVLSMIDRLLSGGILNDNRKVTTLLDFAEKALRLIGPQLNSPQTRHSKTNLEVELLLQRGADLPRGPVSMSFEHIRLNSSWETAAGDASSYPGFATISLLSYKGLQTTTHAFYNGGNKSQDQLELNSKVVTASVSNANTAFLREPVVFTFHHLKQSDDGTHTCVYWDPGLGGGAWSDQGCTLLKSNANLTVCSCNHLSSFAVLLALYEIEDSFELQVITWVGLSLSLLCLSFCILTFSLCRTIQSTRNTIHLHLCISLFIANLVFLAGISRTENRVGCGIAAGLLHYFFLAAFCWMCLEGVQLFRMVVLVFNTTIRPLYMIAGGYGVPALIVILSAIVNSQGYGTKRHCWLSLENNFIWSFFGPVCAIIMVNVLFFLITVWKLAEKFSSLNPDLNNLHKIKTFTVTSVAQLCILGTMWIFGCFQFDQGTLAMSYIFTILNSLQGVLIFIMHCLLSKQVREEYGKFLSSVCAPRRKYSEFSSNQASKSQTSKSAENTGESHI